MTLPASNISQTTIAYLFHGRETVTLPFYQRGYSWDTKEIDELFDDILLGFKEAKEDNTVEDGYLLGNIVLLTFDRKENFLLDGQQRLTTMFLILEELKKHIPEKYEGLQNIINSAIFEVDSYGNTDEQIKIKRETKPGELLDFSMQRKLHDYIIAKVRNELLYDEMFEENEMIDFILNISFMTQKYVGHSTDTDYKNKTFKNILKYFVKFNTRGKAFDPTEMSEAIALLN